MGKGLNSTGYSGVSGSILTTGAPIITTRDSLEKALARRPFMYDCECAPEVLSSSGLLNVLKGNGKGGHNQFFATGLKSLFSRWKRLSQISYNLIQRFCKILYCCETLVRVFTESFENNLFDTWWKH